MYRYRLLPIYSLKEKNKNMTLTNDWGLGFNEEKNQNWYTLNNKYIFCYKLPLYIVKLKLAFLIIMRSNMGFHLKILKYCPMLLKHFKGMKYPSKDIRDLTFGVHHGYKHQTTVIVGIMKDFDSQWVQHHFTFTVSETSLKMALTIY